MPEDKAEAILRDLNTSLWNYQLEFNSLGLPRDLFAKLPEIEKELTLLGPMFQR